MVSGIAGREGLEREEKTLLEPRRLWLLKESLAQHPLSPGTGSEPSGSEYGDDEPDTEDGRNDVADQPEEGRQ